MTTIYRSKWRRSETDAVILIGQLASSCSGNITPIERFDTSRTGREILKAIRWRYLQIKQYTNIE
jgi:hypothetical protein